MNINFPDMSPSTAMWVLLVMMIAMLSYLTIKIVKSVKWWKASKKWSETIVPGDTVLVSNTIDDSQREGILHKDNGDGTVDIIIKLQKSRLYKPFK